MPVVKPFIQSVVLALLALSNPGARAQSVVRLAPANLSVSESWPEAVFTVQRTTDLESYVTVEFATADVTAIAHQDYEPIAGTLTFPPGLTQQTLRVPILNDAIPEPTKAFALKLASPGGGAVLGSNTTSLVRIVDNDTGIQLEFNAYAVHPAAEGVLVTVTRGPDEKFVSGVDYTTGDLTAKAGEEYVTTRGTLEFAPGEWRKDIRVPILRREALDEKRFRFSVANPTGATALGRNAEADVILRASQRGVTFGQPLYVVSEGAGGALIQVWRGSAIDLGPLTVDYATADETALAGVDYTPQAGTLSFAAGEQLKTFVVPVANNGRREAARTVGLTLSNPTGPLGLGPFGTATLRIEDNDPGFGFDQPTYSVWRNSGEVAVTITRGNDGARAPASVSYRTFDLGAIAGLDYEAVSGTLFFEANTTAKTVTIPLFPSAVPSQRKSFAVLLDHGSGVSWPPDAATATVEILDLGTTGGRVVPVAPPTPSGLKLSPVTPGVQQLSWVTTGQLQRADQPERDWQTLPLARSPLTIATTAPACFFRVGEARPARLFIPSKYNRAAGLPLVIVLHAYGTTSLTYEDYMRLAPIAEAKGFFYCCPEGTRDPWGNQFWAATDGCCNAFGAGTDDASYLRSLILEIARRFAVDKKRIYLVGHSNGGFMAYRMACQSADLIAGIVSLEGASFAHPEPCVPSEPVNILQIHGTADAVVPYEGGLLGRAQLFPIDFPPFPSAMETVRLRAANNGCGNPVQELEPTLDLDLDVPGPDTIITRCPNCRPGGAVELWTIEGGAHSPTFFRDNAASQFSERIIDWLLAHPKP